MYKIMINRIENDAHLLYVDVECDNLKEVNRVVIDCWQYDRDITDIRIVHIERYQARTGKKP